MVDQTLYSGILLYELGKILLLRWRRIGEEDGKLGLKRGGVDML